jgi:hypothetical protein
VTVRDSAERPCRISQMVGAWIRSVPSHPPAQEWTVRGTLNGDADDLFKRRDALISLQKGVFAQGDHPLSDGELLDVF